MPVEATPETFQDLTREGNVFVDTGSGETTLTRIRGDELGIDTGSGSVRGSSIEVSHRHSGSGRYASSSCGRPRLPL